MNPESNPFNYLEYIEFRATEFKKFRQMPIITKEEVAKVDMDVLCEKLYNDCMAPKRRDTQ